MKNILFQISEIILFKLINKLPSFFSVFLAKRGLINVIKRSSKVNFVGNLYDTKLKINVRADYRIERNAARKLISLKDPYNGLRKILIKDFIVFDIGANAGTMSLSFVSRGAKRVYAFEPGPIYERLIKNIELNSLQKIVSPFKIGFSDRKSTLFWAEDKNNPGNAHLISSTDDLSYDKINTKFEVKEFISSEVTTIDDFVIENNFINIDLIKIDVEGMEWKVVCGGRNCISKFRPIVVAETHRSASDMMKYDCMTPMFDFFYSMNYLSYSIDESGNLTKFIYPNFGIDTFFIPFEKKDLITL